MKEIIEAGRPATPEEQSVLVQYTGWGALKPVIHGTTKGWEDLHAEVKELLTDDEMKSAYQSIQNAHFTPPAIIKGMYDVVMQLGVQGGTMLEPSVGIGHYLGMMPGQLIGTMGRWGIDRDILTANIAKLLYPSVSMHNKEFQRTALPRDAFDLVISNVPFGPANVHDPKFPRQVLRTIHDYYFVRSIDLLRPGGIGAFITSAGFMDKPNKAVRQFIDDRANLIGAFRLNNRSLPGTPVVADIIYFQKRMIGQGAERPDWIKSVPLEAFEGMQVNEYWLAHPDHVLGDWVEGTMQAAHRPPKAVPRTARAKKRAELLADVVAKADVEMSVKPPASWGDAKNPVDVAPFLEEALSKWVAKLPSQIVPAAVYTPIDPNSLIASPDDVPRGSWYLDEKGELWQNNILETDLPVNIEQAKFDEFYATYKKRGKKANPVLWRTKAARDMSRVKDLVRMRDTALRLLNAQVSPDEKERDKILDLRKELGLQYDRFKYDNGPIRKNAGFFEDDPLSDTVLSGLEVVDAEKDTITKSAIFTKDILAPTEHKLSADDAPEALAISFDEKGYLDPDRMGELLGKDPDDVVSELVDLQMIHRTPTGELMPSDEYLSGNVIAKLEEAQEALEGGDLAMTKNVADLKAVIPRPKTPEEIYVTMGATWIPREVLEEFVQQLFHPDMRISQSQVTGLINAVAQNSEASHDRSVISQWGVVGEDGHTYDGIQIFNDMVQSKIPTVSRTDSDGRHYIDEDMSTAARHKGSLMLEAFRQWLWEDGKRQRELLHTYNRNHNNLVPWKADGNHLTFPGMSPIYKGLFRPYQKDSVWEDIRGGNRLKFHVVGSGKTWELIASAAELMRLGIANKPLLVVYNSTLGQFFETAKQMYPNLPIVALTREDLKDEKKRRRVLAGTAFRDKVMTIIPVSVFEDLSLSADRIEAFYTRKLDDLRIALLETNSASPAHRQIAAAIDSMETKMRDRVEGLRSRPGQLTMEQLGFDYIYYDESQQVKNIPTGQTIEGVRGLPPPKGSDRAFDMLMKADYMASIQNGRGLIMASGTPIDNSIVEMYAVQQYMMPDTLRRMGISTMLQWIRTFGEIADDTETTIEQQYRNVFRLRHFRNVSELINMWLSFTSVVTAEDVDAQVAAEARRRGEEPKLRPKIAMNSKGERNWEIVAVEATDSFNRFMADVLRRSEIVRYQGKAEPGDDIMPSLATVGMRAAIDLRLEWRAPKSQVEGDITDDPRPKVTAMVKNVRRLYDLLNERKGVQLIAMNQGTTSDDKSGIYVVGEIIDDLVKSGIPREEIATIWDAPSAVTPAADAKRLALFRKVNSGEIRVFIGSIRKMGIGVNIQTLLAVLHALDPPWTPGMVEQIFGRPVRWGNLFDEVQLYRYVQQGQGSADEFMWQIVVAKQKALYQLLRGQAGDVSTFEDVDPKVKAMEMAQGMSASDPTVLEWAKARHNLTRLQSLERSHQANNHEMVRSKSEAEDRVTYATNRLAELVPFVKAVEKYSKGDPVTIGSKKYTKNKEIGQAIVEALGKYKNDTWHTVGRITPMDDIRVRPYSQKAKELLWDLDEALSRGWNKKAPLIREKLEAAMLLPADRLEIGIKFDRNLADSTTVDFPAPKDGAGLANLATVALNRLNIPMKRRDELRETLKEAEQEIAGIEQHGPGAFTEQLELDAAQYEADRLESIVVAAGQPIVLEGADVQFKKDASWWKVETIRLKDDVGEVDLVRRGDESRASAQTMSLDDFRIATHRNVELPGEIKDEIDLTKEPVGTRGELDRTLRTLNASAPGREMWSGLFGQLPRGQRADLVRFLRKNYDANQPFFGMGAMWNMPEVRNRWKRWFDRWSVALQSQDAGTWRKTAIDMIGRGLYGTDQWGQHPEHADAIQRFHGSKKLALAEAQVVGREMTAHLNSVEAMYGGKTKSKLNILLNRVAEEGHWVEGETEREWIPDYVDDLPDAARKIFYAMRDIVRSKSGELLDLPHLHKYAEAAGLVNLLDIMRRKHMSDGMYLRMIYKKPHAEEARAKGYLASKRGIFWQPSTRPRIKKLIMGMYKHRRTGVSWGVQLPDGVSTVDYMDEDSALEHANKILNDPEMIKAYGDSLKDRVKVIDPFGVELLAHREPQLDFVQRFMRTVTDMSHNLELLKLQYFLAQSIGAMRDAEAFSLEEGEEPAGMVDWVQLPNSMEWGPLAGMEVPIDLADALTQVRHINESWSSQLYSLYQYVWKSSKVTWSPPTWFNQFLGATWFSMMGGVDPVRHYPAYRLAAEHFRDQHPWYKQAVRENWINVGFSHQEMERLREMMDDPTNTLIVAFGKWAEWMLSVNEKLGKGYDFVDQLNKYAAYLKFRKFDGMTHEESVYMVEGYPNYARAGDFAEAMSKHPLGAPFIRFTSTSVQAYFYYARNAPARLLFVQLLPGLMTLITKMMLGWDDDDLEAEIKLINASYGRSRGKGHGWLPDPFAWQESYFQPLTPFRDKNGRLIALDIRFSWPLANEFRTTTGPGGIGLPILLSQPLIKTLMEQMANRNFYTGLDITRESDSTLEAFKRDMAHITLGLIPLPSLLTTGISRVYKSATEDTEQGFIRTVLDQFFRVKIKATRVTRAEAYALLKSTFADRKTSDDYQKMFNGMMRVWNRSYRNRKRDKRIIGARVRRSQRDKEKKVRIEDRKRTRETLIRGRVRQR